MASAKPHYCSRPIPHGSGLILERRECEHGEQKGRVEFRSTFQTAAVVVWNASECYARLGSDFDLVFA